MQLSSNIKDILLDTKGQYMKESDTLAGNAIIKQQQRDILLNTKGQCMKESCILAANATIKQHQKDILLNTKGQYMKYACMYCPQQFTSRQNLKKAKEIYI